MFEKKKNASAYAPDDPSLHRYTKKKKIRGIAM